MSYYVYLHIPNGGAFERTEIGSRSIAESAFKAYLERMNWRISRPACIWCTSLDSSQPISSMQRKARRTTGMEE
jgi:hypothetical protein